MLLKPGRVAGPEVTEVALDRVEVPQMLLADVHLRQGPVAPYLAAGQAPVPHASSALPPSFLFLLLLRQRADQGPAVLVQVGGEVGSGKVRRPFVALEGGWAVRTIGIVA